jgi:HlyD family secretion protein
MLNSIARRLRIAGWSRARSRSRTAETKAQLLVTGPATTLRRHMLAGFALLVLLVGGLGSWAATAQIGGAVLASGTVVVDSNVKKVQHLTGGIVGELRVKDGAQVAAGDLLMRLDDTIVRTNLQIVLGQLDQITARQVRLKAERDGAYEIKFPDALWSSSDKGQIAEISDGEKKLFESRRSARAGQKAQLTERIAQYREEVIALTSQRGAKTRELELIGVELKAQKSLWEQNLLPISKYTALQRDQARIEGERGALSAQAAQSKGKIAEIELQILQIDNELRSEVMKDLRETQAKESELAERKVAATDQLRRIDIRAPQAGVVHQMSVHTVGGVVAQGETVMLIVPASDRLVIEARIAPQDIDHVRPGQTAHIRFPAFNQRTTPEFDAIVERVSADAARDTQLNQSYFVARLVLPEDQLKRMGALKLQAGMPAEIHLRTTDRTAISYLMKPLQDQFARAFKEQ